MDTKINDSMVVIDDINNLILEFCETYSIDPQEITPQQWTGALTFAGRILFADRTKLRLKPYDNNKYNGGISNNNSYDIDILNNIYNNYCDMCNIYSKVIRISDYISFIGITYSTLESIKNATEPRGQNATLTGSDFYKKMQKDNESSLVGRLLDKGTNPMKVLPILNNKHGWADKKTVIEHETSRIAPKSRTDILAEFGQTAIESNEN